MKRAAILSAVACAASANAFVLPPPTSAAVVQRAPALRMVGHKHVGAGGMADTRDPTPYVDPDSRKSITKAPSFEEYMREQAAKRAGGSAAPATAQSTPSSAKTAPGHKGAGGMADTRDPEPYVDPLDSRKSISKAPSFEEYLRQQQAKKGGGSPAPAPAQAPPPQAGGQKPLSPFEEYMLKRNGGGSPAPTPAQATPPQAQAAPSGQKPLSPFEEYMLKRNGGGGSSPAPTPSSSAKTAPGHKGAGGMADTRDPEPFIDPSDSRKSITKAPSFEEYMREQAAKRARGGN